MFQKRSNVDLESVSPDKPQCLSSGSIDMKYSFFLGMRECELCKSLSEKTNGGFANALKQVTAAGRWHERDGLGPFSRRSRGTRAVFCGCDLAIGPGAGCAANGVRPWPSLASPAETDDGGDRRLSTHLS